MTSSIFNKARLLSAGSVLLLGLLLIASCPQAADAPAQDGTGPDIGDSGTAGGNGEPPPPQADPAGGRQLPLGSIKLPAGFSIAAYAADVPNARSLCLTPAGTLFVGNRGGDKVYALRDEDGDLYAERQYVIASGMNMPNGVAWRSATATCTSPKSIASGASLI
jgi:glucose/arabinose dehydrogenase